MTRTCPICAGPTHETAHLKGDFTANRCESCAVVFAHPMPTADDLEKYYSQWLFSLPSARLLEQWRAHTKRLASDMVADISRRRGKPVKRVLDYGGGLGYFARGFADVVERSSLFDMSNASLDYARAEHGGAIEVYASSDEAIGAGPYDLVIVNQVIEHVPDPVDFLGALAPALATGGVLVVSTPNNAMSDPLYRRDLLRRYAAISTASRRSSILAMARDSWVGLEPPRHLFAFNDTSIAKAARLAGYQPLDVTTHAYDADPLGYPTYTKEGSNFASKLRKLQRKAGVTITAMLDRKRRRRNTLVGYFVKA